MLFLDFDTVTLPVVNPIRISLFHNLPIEPGVFFITQFVRAVGAADAVVVTRDKLSFPLAAIDASARYKLLALKIQNGIADGVWWVDNYVYNPGQLNIEFTSQGQSSGTGEPKSFTGRTTVNKAPVSRTVIAVGIDGEAPVFLAQTQSNENTGQYTLEWQGYDGQVLITALDNYGVPFNSGDARGVGERVHPAIPNGYVYQVSMAGQLAEEPAWPTTEGALVMSGTCQLVAVPFYRPKTVGPIVV
jgi:hypothetical protein